MSNSFISWLNYVDPTVKKVPVLAASPVYIFTFLIVYLLIAIYLGPLYMSTRKAHDLRPYMLISNAIIFGASAMGIPLAMYLTSWGTIPWQCPEPVISQALLETQVYLGVAFLAIQMFTTTTTFYMIARKKESQSPGINALRISGLIILIYFGARQYPRGPFLFRPICEITLATVRRAYYILMAPGQPFRHYQSLRHRINYLTLLSGLLNTVHIGYLFTRDCPGDMNIKFISMFTSLVETIYLLYQLYHNQPSKHQSYKSNQD